MIYKYEHRPMGRSKTGGGKKSAVAAAAYRSGAKLLDTATNKIYDYTRKSGILHNAIIAPPGELAPNREALWNMAEAAEKREDARIGREIIAALDPDLSLKQNIQICDQHAKSLAAKYGCVVDYSIHAPPPGGDPRNLHVHFFITTRKLENGIFTEKTDIEKSDTALKKENKDSGRKQIKALRENWQNTVNATLEEAGKKYKIDARSYAERGENIMPGIHLGVDNTRAERRGERTERGDYNRMIAAINAAQAELERREKEEAERSAAGRAMEKEIEHHTAAPDPEPEPEPVAEEPEEEMEEWDEDLEEEKARYAAEQAAQKKRREEEKRRTLAPQPITPPEPPPPVKRTFKTGTRSAAELLGPGRSAEQKAADRAAQEAARKAAEQAEREKERKNEQIQNQAIGRQRQPGQETTLERRQREHRQAMEKAGVYTTPAPAERERGGR